MTNMDILKHLPAHLRDKAKKLPKGKEYTILELAEEGQGHNASLIKVASICYKMGVSAEDTLAHLKDLYNQDRVDYATAPNRAVLRIWDSEGEIPLDDDQKKYEPNLQEEMLLRFRRTATSGLVEESPHECNKKPASIIEALFDGDDIINIQQTSMESGTLVKVKDLREEYGDILSQYKFLNPSTFKKIKGVKNPLDPENPNLVTRCNANVKNENYMVLEMDEKEESKNERFNTFAMTLSNFCPLVLAVDTGNKSIHYWYDTSNAKPKEEAAIFSIACMHGADKRLGVKSQIARMPNVSAATPGRGAQRVVYYDPNHEKCPEGLKWDVEGFEEYILKAQQLDYYYLGSNSYYMQSNTNTWVSLSRTSLIKQLVMQGFRDQKMEKEQISPTDKIIAQLEVDRHVEAVLKGAAGKHAGYYQENGFSFLVAKSPTLLKPRKGDCSTIRGIIEHQLGAEPIQIPIFYGWLAQSIKDFRNGGKRQSRISPAQMLHIAGDPNSFKSALLKYVLPYLFGGRSAKADPLFSEKGSDFNSEMFASELLYLDDSNAIQSNHQSRAYAGEVMKNITVGGGDSYHGKHGDKVNATPWWRIIRLMNTEPETLATLPTGENGTDDKFILLYARSMQGGIIDSSEPGWFDSVVKPKLINEREAFLQFLLEEFVILPEALDPERRYAVKSYKNPTLMLETIEDSAEQYVMQKVDASQIFDGGFDGDKPPYWQGSSSALYELLAETGSKTAQYRFRKLCPSPRVLTAQLRQLERQQPNRVKYSGRAKLEIKKLEGKLFWRIMPPQGADECF